MTDVFEDMEIVLERAVQYLTYVLDNLLRRIHLNKHRPINRRNLVRWMAVFIPAPKDPRVKLQSKLRDGNMRTALQRWGSSGSLESVYSAASLQNLVEEDLGDNMVRFRIGSCEDGECSEVNFEDAHFIPIPDLSNRFTSTPNFDLSACSSVVSSNQGGKLAEMEAELAALRKQIAVLVIAQESSMVSDKTKEAGSAGLEESETLSASPAAALPLPGSPKHSSTLNDSGCESSEGVPVGTKQSHPKTLWKASTPDVAVPAPPPPPPLPLFLEAKRRESVGELIRKRKATRTNQQENQGVPDMADVLKGLGSVKLRAVERSPGGTPMTRCKLERTPTDPASIIALALKKKFASHRGFSPESDQENDMSSFLSDQSQSSPFGQHMLKKTKRRLSLFNESEDWTPVSSPLRTLNL